MSMKCGNYKRREEAPHYHANAEEVRACYQKAGKIDGPWLPDGPVKGSAGERRSEPLHPVPDHAGKYLLRLQRNRVLPDGWLKVKEEDIPFMEWDDVDAKIKRLKRQPYTNLVPGRYALMINGEWRFYEVTFGRKGTKWEGWSFIVRLIGAPGTYRKVRMSGADAGAVMDECNKDPNKAMTDYGVQSGVCGRCASPLTDPQSLARGIGPVCLGKLGW